MIQDKYVIRQQNESIVLKTIIENRTISRAEIANQVGLNKASVSSIVNDLLDKQIILETGIGSSGNSGGRKPISLEFNPASGMTLALDIGYNYVNYALAYLDGTFFIQEKLETSITKHNCIPHIIEIVNNLIQKMPKTHHGIIGMTIAIHGIVDHNHIVFTPSYNLDQLDLYLQLTNYFEFPIFLENEANLTALGEFTFFQSIDNIISISIHSGIGAGIIQNKKLLHGAHSQAGEMGHTILYPNGKLCSCGNHGCLEKYASNRAIYESFSQHFGLEKANSDNIVDAISNNDHYTTELLNAKTKELAVGINNLALLYDTQLIIVNSSIFLKLPQFLEPLKSALNSKFTREIDIIISESGDNATLYGGVALSVASFLNIESVQFAKIR
ncbi:ROK family transcriptional regulator [Streptococcus thoraltensis]|uniref:ROK family transcriptional regulator n=1 Tax=Streptococcus thoraltensis TaxID=55085 RepID=UPI00038176EC|nr:ROK family transcriptional regulator [Streptococcus thoraltensis]MDY4761791.1 ROK family transcriptional regulator [Streptococcus thoraltensis]